MSSSSTTSIPGSDAEGVDLTGPPSLPPSESPPEPLLKAALRILSRRFRSEREMRDRLLKKGFSPRDIGSCIRWLKERRLLDDRAFALSFTRDRLRFSPRSPFLVRRELCNKGVEPAVAQEAVDAVLEEEGFDAEWLASQTAAGWVRRQSRPVLEDLLGVRFSPRRERARERLYRFMARRGFVGEAARQGLEVGVSEARSRLDDLREREESLREGEGEDGVPPKTP